jgi:hypothetical protein
VFVVMGMAGRTVRRADRYGGRVRSVITVCSSTSAGSEMIEVDAGVEHGTGGRVIASGIGPIKSS